MIRKTARLANYYHSKWYVLYVQTPKESADKIALDKQRYLINNFKLATELGGEIIKVKGESVSKAIIEQASERKITMHSAHRKTTFEFIPRNFVNQYLQSVIKKIIIKRH